MSDALEIRLLGPFEVIADGRPVDVPGTKRQALLALLALGRGRVLPVDDLIDALWGADLPASPRNAVQHHIARLRTALGREAIAASGDGYALCDASVDAIEFEQLLARAVAARREGDVRAAAERAAAALELWRGTALQGLTDAPWFGAEGRRLDALRVDALEEWFDSSLALGEHREVLAELRRALDEHPYRERLWGLLMLALYRSGQQADALDAFHQARRVLRDSLGLEPGQELRSLQEAILEHDPTLAAIPLPPAERGNVPASSTSFVGRGAEVEEVIRLLSEHRAVTLIGPPGVGKTRIALEVVRTRQPHVTGGVWFVDLSRAVAPGDVVRLLARGIDPRGDDELERVIERLRDVEAVILFDSCERLLEEVRHVAAALLEGCAGVRLLATSREVLRVTGEVRMTIAPLAVEPREEDPDSPAVSLFLERARAARPGFELDPESAGLVAAIVRRVDGLPLAIELAAARVNVLGPAELLSLVDRRLAIFDGDPNSDAGAAIRTLVEWSYDLLHADEKTLLHLIAVHRGGSSRDSLVAAAGNGGLDEATVTHLVGALVDKSIVSVSFPDGAARYTLLDTVRDYALDRLRESGGAEAARAAHAAYFAEMAQSSQDELRGPGWLSWMRRLALENDNLWAALAWSTEHGDRDLAMRLAAPLGWYFALGERVSEGRRFLELALESGGGSPSLRSEALAMLCYLATEELDLAAALSAGEEALSLADRPGGAGALTVARIALALALVRSGEPDRATTLLEEARRDSEDSGDEWGAAASSLVRAQGAAAAGDVDTVAAMAAELIRHAEAIDYDAFVVPGRLLVGWVAESRTDFSEADDAYRRALDAAERTGFADHAAFALARLGSIALAGGDRHVAERLLGQALAAAEAAQAPWIAAHARVELGKALASSGDETTADRLYRAVLEWSALPRSHQARESLFVVLALDPPTAALLGLADLAEARGDAATAGELRRRAGLATV
jgi:predicted ATPase/DNA-binding SARP family transcriptional activator